MVRSHSRLGVISVLVLFLATFALNSCGSGTGGADKPFVKGKESTLALKVEDVVAVPPAGVRVLFSILKDNGDPVERLEDGDFQVVNSETDKPFGSEGGSKPFLAEPTDFIFYTILTLDMSDSIFNNNAQDAVIQGAKTFLESIKGQLDGGRHLVAIYAFGSSTASELWADFTSDFTTLTARLESLKAAGSRGGTNLYGAYLQAMELVRNKGIDENLATRSLVILTDGTHEAGNRVQLREQALQSLRKGDVNAFSIGIRGDFNVGAIRELASSAQNFFLVDDTAQLTEVFNDISTRVLGLSTKDYILGICSPVEVGEPSVIIKASKDGIRGTVTVPYDVNQVGWSGNVSKCYPPAVAVPPVALASNQLLPSAVVVDSSSVYWTTRGTPNTFSDGRVAKVSKNGGTPIDLAVGQPSPQDLAVDAGHIYWVNSGTPPGFTDGSIMRTPLLGAGGTTTLAAGQIEPRAIALDSTHLYWANSDGTIMKMPKDGSTAPTPIVTGQASPRDIAVDATNVYWANAGSQPNFADGSIMKLPLGSVDPPITLASGQFAPQSIALDSTHIYWANYGTTDPTVGYRSDGSINKVPLSGGAPVILASAQNGPRSIAVDDQNIYWADGGVFSSFSQGTVLRVPLNGGNVTTIAFGENAPGHVAIDSVSLYWSTEGTRVSGVYNEDGTVVKGPK